MLDYLGGENRALKHPLALKPAQKTLAHLLALGVPADDAARQLGVSKAYVEVLMKGGLFMGEVDAARRELIGERLDEYNKLVSEQLLPNLQALIDIRDNEKLPPSSRLRAIELLNESLVPKAGKKAPEPEARARITFSVEQQAEVAAVLDEAKDVTHTPHATRDDRRGS